MCCRQSNWTCLCQHMKSILNRGNEAHTSTVVPVEAVVRAEARVVEAHVVRPVAIEVPDRPVIAEAAHI